MSLMLTHADALADVTALVRAGELDAAKREAARLLDTADEHTRDTLARCTWTLTHRPRTAITDLRQLAQTAATEQDAELIRACTPDPIEYHARPETQPPQDDRAPHWSADTRYQAPHDEHSRTDPAARRTARQRHQVGQAQPPLSTLDYFSSRTEGYDYRPDEWTQHTPEGYSLDYDRAAVPPLRGQPCLFCWIERAPAEVHRAAQMRTGHGDDGLCADCRELAAAVDIPRGIPPLSPTHTYRDQVQARCHYIAEWHPAAALTILAHEWQRARRCAGPAKHDPDTCTRHLIAEWVHTHRAELDRRAAKTRPALHPAPRPVTGASRNADTPNRPRPEAPTPNTGARPPARHRRQHEPERPAPAACRRCYVPRDASDLPQRGRDDRQCSACRALAAEPAELRADVEQLTAA